MLKTGDAAMVKMIPSKPMVSMGVGVRVRVRVRVRVGVSLGWLLGSLAGDALHLVLSLAAEASSARRIAAV